MALHNCGMILSQKINYNPRVTASPRHRVSLNYPSIQQRQNYYPIDESGGLYPIFFGQLNH